MRAVRWLRWAGLAVGILITLLLVAGWGASQSAWGRNEVRQLVEQQAARFLDGTLKVDGISGSLVGGVTLNGVRFTHQDRDVFVATTVDVRFNLVGWMRGRREIASIRIVNPVIRIAEQRLNWDTAGWVRPRQSTGGPSRPVLFPSIEIVNGRLLSSAKETTWHLPPEISAINGVIALKVGGGTRIDITRLAFTAGALHARAVTGVLTFAGDTRLERLRVDSDAGVLAIDGRVGPPAPRAIDLAATLTRFDATRWRVFTPLLDTIDFTATGTAVFGGNMDRLTIKSALDTSAGKLTGDTVIASRPSELRITGTAETVAFDAQHVIGDPQWASAVTGHAQYTLVSTGTPSVWTSDVTFAGGPVRAFNALASRLDATMHYAAKVVTFAGTATAYGASTRAKGTVTVGDELVIEVTGDRLTGMDLRQWPAEWGFVALEANLNATAYTARWTPSRWSMRATLADSVVEGAELLAGTQVELSGAKDSLTIGADGRWRPLVRRGRGKAPGLTGLTDPIFVTDLNGHIKVAGQGRNLSEMDLTAQVELLDSRAAAGASVPSATVAYTRQSHVNTAHIVGELRHLNPATLGASEALKSDINGHADMTAVWRDDAADIPSTMTARGTLRATASVISDLPIDRAVITGEWRDGVFAAESATLQNQGVSFTGRGRIAVSAGESNTTFEVTATDVASLEPWTGRAAHGALTARGELLGTFDAPRVRATFESPRVNDPSLGALGGVTGAVDVVFPEWVLDQMRGMVRVAATAWTSDTGSTAQQITAEGQFLTRTSVSTATLHGIINETDVRASLHADWTTDVTADITALEARRGGQTWRLDAGSGPLQISETHLTGTNVQLSNGAQRVVLAGRVALAELEAGGDAGDQLTARATAIDLEALDAFLGVQTGAKGQVNGDLTLVGRLSDPRGRITLSARDLTVRGYKIAEAGGTIDLADGGATSALTMKQPDGVSAIVSGRAPLAWLLPAGTLDPAVPEATWDLTAVTDPINLEILGAVAPKLTEISGQAIVDLRIVGAAAEPKLTGTVAVGDGRFRVPSAGTLFSKINSDIGFGVDTITVRRFTARDKNDHTLTITGELAVNERQLDRLQAHVEADRFTVVDNRIAVIALSSLLELTGDASHPRLTGNLEVASGRVEVDRLLRALQGDPLALVSDAELPAAGTTLVDLKADAAAAAAEEAARPPAEAFDSRSFLSRLAVDVQVFVPDNLIVRGSRIRPGGKDSWSLGDLNVTVGADLRATRAPGGSATLLGDVTAVRGSYSFENRRFEIQRGGRIRFQGESPLDPTFDIRGVRVIQGVEARVDVRGRLSEPRLQLGSNVPLDESDVLSMIIFNRPVNQLGETQRADLVGAAASFAGGYVTSPLTSSLSRALNLDLLEVETVSFGQNVTPRVLVGQQLTSRLFVQLSQQFGAESLTELTAEYQLKKFLRLQGRSITGPGSNAQRSLLQRTERAGIDLLFFFNY